MCIVHAPCRMLQHHTLTVECPIRTKCKLMIKTKLFTVIILSLIVSSCTGQKSKNEIKSISSEKKVEDSKHHTSNTENFLLYSDINHQISQVVRTIFQDSKGDIWFGGEGGAFRYSNNSLTHIKSIVSKSGKRVTVKDIAEDNDGKIWIGHTDGISSVEGEKVTNYDESDGLISNDVWSIETDRNNRIWIGTIEGLCFFNGQEFTNFRLPEGKIDSSLGISSTKMIHNIFEDSKGTLWFSSNAGLFSYGNDSLRNGKN